MRGGADAPSQMPLRALGWKAFEGRWTRGRRGWTWTLLWASLLPVLLHDPTVHFDAFAAQGTPAPRALWMKLRARSMVLPCPHFLLAPSSSRRSNPAKIPDPPLRVDESRSVLVPLVSGQTHPQLRRRLPRDQVPLNLGGHKRQSCKDCRLLRGVGKSGGVRHDCEQS